MLTLLLLQPTSSANASTAQIETRKALVEAAVPAATVINVDTSADLDCRAQCETIAGVFTHQPLDEAAGIWEQGVGLLSVGNAGCGACRRMNFRCRSYVTHPLLGQKNQ